MPRGNGRSFSWETGNSRSTNGGTRRPISSGPAIAPALASGQIAAETLPYNYRSTPLLIAFFNHLVAELFAGTDKVNLQAPPEKPKYPYSGLSEVAVIPAACGAGDDPAYERLVEAIMQKKAECGCPWGDMAVLCRTNGHMDKVAAALAQGRNSHLGDPRTRALVAPRGDGALSFAHRPFHRPRRLASSPAPSRPWAMTRR